MTRHALGVVLLLMVIVVADGAAAQTAVGTPSLRLTARDIARGLERPRGLDVIRREVGILDRLVESSRPTDPALFELVERQARLHIELSREALDRAHGAQAEPVGSARSTQSTRLRAVAADAHAEADVAARSAFERYRELHADFPADARLERTLLVFATLVQQYDGIESARPIYLRIVRDRPQSSDVPIVYALFGDEHFVRGDIHAAVSFYERVLHVAPRHGVLFAYALYRLGWCEHTRGDFARSLQRFAETLEHLRTRPAAAGSAELGAAARRDMVVAYARVGRRDRAEAFFRRYATVAEAREMLNLLDSLRARRPR